MAIDRRSLAGLLLFVAASVFSVGMIIAEALYPGYSVSQNYISDLGVGPSAWIFNSSVIILGALTIAAAYSARKVFGRILVILLIVTGAGAMGVGVFTEASGIVHTIVSFTAFLFAGLAAIWTFRLVRPPFAYLSAAFGAISLVALGLFASGTYVGLGQGGMERMIVYPVLVWAAGFGGALMAAEEAGAPAPTT